MKRALAALLLAPLGCATILNDDVRMVTRRADHRRRRPRPVSSSRTTGRAWVRTAATWTGRRRPARRLHRLPALERGGTARWQAPW